MGVKVTLVIILKQIRYLWTVICLQHTNVNAGVVVYAIVSRLEKLIGRTIITKSIIFATTKPFHEIRWRESKQRAVKLRKSRRLNV